MGAGVWAYSGDGNGVRPTRRVEWLVNASKVQAGLPFVVGILTVLLVLNCLLLILLVLVQLPKKDAGAGMAFGAARRTPCSAPVRATR